MRIDRLYIRNFKKFDERTIELHPQFTLLVGENGAGKTSVLDALTVAAGVWLIDPPDSTLVNSGRTILPSEIRLEPVQQGDRTQFREAATGVIIRAEGQINGDDNITWSRKVLPGKRRTSNTDAKQALAIIAECYSRVTRNEEVLLPVIAYYGAGRAWLPHRERYRKSRPAKDGPARRWAAFYDCLEERIRTADLTEWFQAESLAAVNLGRVRPGFEAVRRAVLNSVPEADGLWYDGDRKEIVLSICGNPQPFSNLSAGQRMMLALVADIAVKAVTQNAHLLPSASLGAEDEPLPRVLAQTPGIVLIDELDVHLHPRWQRRVATDLKRTFPSIQFVCTSHSPQVIGEVQPEEIRLLTDDSSEILSVQHSFGLDSNAILEDIMDAAPRTPLVERKIDEVEAALEEGDLHEARNVIEDLKQIQNGLTRDSARLEAAINNLEMLAHAGD